MGPLPEAAFWYVSRNPWLFNRNIAINVEFSPDFLDVSVEKPGVVGESATWRRVGSGVSLRSGPMMAAAGWVVRFCMKHDELCI